VPHVVYIQYENTPKAKPPVIEIEKW